MTAILLLAAVLLVLVLADRAVRRLPMSAALVYLIAGWAGGTVLGMPSTEVLLAQAPQWLVVTEVAVLVSLVAVGLRLKVPPRVSAWAVALILAGPGMVATMVLATGAAVLLLGLPWPAALLLAAVLAPTDPVLASEVQIHSPHDRDVVRLSLTAEGGLNDGTALPGVMLGLGLLGLHTLGPWGANWWWHDLLWPIGGGMVLGVAVGLALGQALRWRLHRGDGLQRDELLYVGIVVGCYGLAQLTHTSTFVVTFCVGATVLQPLQQGVIAAPARELADRLHAFGARIERLVEAGMVLAVGVALSGIGATGWQVGFALALVLLVRPVAVLMVVRGHRMTPHQRQLVAWFGIRGVGALYYLAFVLTHGVSGDLAESLAAATLACVAVSIVLHGVSATPMMARYQRRRSGQRPAPPHPLE